MSEKVSTFRERFTELVEASPKSRTTIAREFNVAKQTVSAWVTGQSSPRLPVVAALADYFGVSYKWLLGFDVPKVPDLEEYERYSQYVDESLQAHHALGFITKDESDLIVSYRSLSPKGKSLLIERTKELELLYGKKIEDNSAQLISP